MRTLKQIIAIILLLACIGCGNDEILFLTESRVANISFSSSNPNPNQKDAEGVAEKVPECSDQTPSIVTGKQ